MRNVSQDVVRSTIIAVPTIEEQHLIVQRAAAIAAAETANVRVLTAKQRYREELRASLLSGRPRVPTAETEAA